MNYPSTKDLKVILKFIEEIEFCEIKASRNTNCYTRSLAVRVIIFIKRINKVYIIIASGIFHFFSYFL